jgi:uncharacterized protein (TIGR03435 family)
MSAVDLLAVANHLWQSTLCAGAVWLLASQLKRKRAAVRYWLWLASSVKFLIPFSLLVGIGNLVRWRTAAANPPFQWPVVIDNFSRPFAQAAPISKLDTSSVSETIPIIFFGLWLCGFAISITVLLWHYRRIRADRRKAIPLALSLPIPALSSASRVEPGVFGIREPVLLLPQGIIHHLTPAQLELILAHEICHVRRRDNLTAAVHMVVEAVFWFYPPIWWIRAQLVAERERACDEEVCSQGAQLETYAEAILTVCKFYLKPPPIWSAGITGADLKQRIEAIMARSRTEKVSFAQRMMLASVGIAAISLPLTLGVLNAPPIEAQSSMARPRFDVASIKPSKDQHYTGMVPHPGGYLTANGTLSELMEIVYGVKRTQIVGGPHWIDSDEYQIRAKADSNLSEDQMGQALQVLLEDRFRMTIRRESKEVKTYALVMGRNGIKQQNTSGACVTGDPDKPPPVSQTLCPPTGLVRCTVYSGFVWLQGRRTSTKQLTERLSYFVDRPIVNETGYDGALDVDLQFTPLAFRWPGHSMVPVGSRPDESRPSVFTALREQLGLELESSRDTVELLRIEQVSRPSPN